MTELPKNEYIQVKTLAVVDIDRTVFDTPRFVMALKETARQFGVDLGKMQAAQVQDEATGISFDVGGYVLRALGGEKRRLFTDAFLGKYARDEFLYPDAVGLFELLAQLGVSVSLLTHGSKEGQGLKIATSPHLQRYPYKIIDAPNKGVYLSRSYRDDRFYVAHTEPQDQAYAAQKVWFFDDKLQNFADIPEGTPIVAFHLADRSRTKNIIQPATISVIELKDLSEARPHILEQIAHGVMK